MEQEVFPHPAVSRILETKFVEARLHTDHLTLQDKWNEIEKHYIGYTAQSTYAIIDTRDVAQALRVTNYDPKYKSDPKLFAAWLEGN